jgi:hypothetical protein
MPVAAPSQLDLSSTTRPRTMIALESVTKIGFIFQFFDRLKQPYGRH